MATQWYYKVLEQVVGPLSPSQLLAKVRDGTIAPDSQIRKDDSQWVAAKSVGGLFESAGTGEVQYTCPYCGETVDRPPTTCNKCSRTLERAYTKSNKAPRAPVQQPDDTKAPTRPTPKKEDSPKSLVERLRSKFRRD